MAAEEKAKAAIRQADEAEARMMELQRRTFAAERKAALANEVLRPLDDEEGEGEEEEWGGREPTAAAPPGSLAGQLHIARVRAMS